MPTYSAGDLLLKPSHLGQFGEVNLPEGKVTPTANVVTGDVLRICRIPAGTEVNALLLAHATLGTTVPGDIGYTPVSSADGALAANATYFKAAHPFQTAFDGCISLFDAIKFEQDVYLIVTFGTVTSGNQAPVRSRVVGKNVGVK